MNKQEKISLVEVIMNIGRAAESQIEQATSKDEYAFYLGHINIAASILNALSNNSLTVEISLDYDHVLKMYKEAKQEYEESKANEKQISLNDLYPELMQKLDKINKLLEKSKKNKTDKE